MTQRPFWWRRPGPVDEGSSRSSPPIVRVCLTGGPGGGKTTLIAAHAGRQLKGYRVIALPESIFVAGGLGVDPGTRRFQRLIVEVQRGLEDALERIAAKEHPWLCLCHRGSLDPAAYWLANGWSYNEFFDFTQSTLAEHYRRYDAVVHMVTAADGARDHYRQWPDSHRHETASQAVRIDRLLERVWHEHPQFVRIPNTNDGWPAKEAAVLNAIQSAVGESLGI